MINLTKAQRKSLLIKWQIDNQRKCYRQFRKTVEPVIGLDCVQVPWCGMRLLIETDGHPHS